MLQPLQVDLKPIDLESGVRVTCSTFGPITLVSTHRGYMRRIVQSGVSLWRRLCSLMGALLGDNDESRVTWASSVPILVFLALVFLVNIKNGDIYIFVKMSTLYRCPTS